MDLNTMVYYLSEDSAIKFTLIIYSVLSIFLCYGHFEPLGGAFEGADSLIGPPRGPMRCLLSIATFIQFLVHPLVHWGSLVEFLVYQPYITPF